MLDWKYSPMEDAMIASKCMLIGNIFVIEDAMIAIKCMLGLEIFAIEML